MYRSEGNHTFSRVGRDAAGGDLVPTEEEACKAAEEARVREQMRRETAEEELARPRAEFACVKGERPA